jgi:hypothetical protein
MPIQFHLALQHNNEGTILAHHLLTMACNQLAMLQQDVSAFGVASLGQSARRNYIASCKKKERKPNVKVCN